MSKELSAIFDGTEINILDHNGEQCLTSSEVAKALGYKNEDSVTRIYNRNKEEFEDTMTLAVKLTVKGQKQTTRIFSKRGCHLIGMFAKTPKSKAFRVWVLDALENRAGQSEPALPQPKKTTTQYWITIQHEGQPPETRPIDFNVIQDIVKNTMPEHQLVLRDRLATIIKTTGEAHAEAIQLFQMGGLRQEH